jgi:hypothetical protein
MAQLPPDVPLMSHAQTLPFLDGYGYKAGKSDTPCLAVTLNAFATSEYRNQLF